MGNDEQPKSNNQVSRTVVGTVFGGILGAMLALMLNSFAELPFWAGLPAFLVFLVVGIALGRRAGAYLSSKTPGG